MMDYNNYYLVQTGHQPGHLVQPQTMTTNQTDYSMMGGPMTPNSMMHSSPAPSTPASVRHTPGPPPMQQHHPMSHHHQQQQQSPHHGYHQLPPHPPMSHSASPHPSSTPHSQGQPSPRPATGPSPLHHQSPIHMSGHSPKILQPGPMPVQSQPSNLMPPNGPPMHPSVMAGNNHHHMHHPSGPPPPPPNHGHAYPNNSMPPHGGPHYGQPPMNHQQPPLGPPPMNHRPPPMAGGPMMGGPPPPPSGYMPPHPSNQERGSPFYQQIPQTEFRIIELNKRLQMRPRMRTPSSPLPFPGSSDESDWWESFACDFFDDEATLTIRTPGDDKPIEYSIGRTLIPRFFKSYFDGGVTDLSIKLRNIREIQHHPNLTTMDCDLTDIITKNAFKHPTTQMFMYVHTEGHLRLEFVNNSFDNLVIKSWRFFVNRCHEYIDRSMTNIGLSHTYLAEPITRYGLTKSTCVYLKMCLVMEPMQDLMAHHKQTRLDPRSCLKHLLFDRYKIQTEDKSAQQPKKRKRRAPANPSGVNKKTKANAKTNNNTDAINSNTSAMTGSDPGMTNLPLASQDVLVVGEPSMLSANFSDGHDRQNARLDENQFDSPAEHKGDQTCKEDDSNQANQNQICTPNDAPNQDHQSDNSEHNMHGRGNESTGNNVHPLTGCSRDSDHNEDGFNSNSCTQTDGHDRNAESFKKNHDVSIDIKDNIAETTRTSAPNNISGDDRSHFIDSDLANVLVEEDSLISAKKISDQEQTANDDHAQEDKASPPGDDSSRPVSEEPSEKENNGSMLNDESSNPTLSRNHLNILNRIPEDREDTCKTTDIGLSKLPPSVNKIIVTSNGSGTKQNRRRSSERKETLREGLMRTSDFVVAIKDLKHEHPSLWRITTGNNLLQQFEPKVQNGTILYENTNQYAGWNVDIKRDYVGVDVKLTQHTRNQITVERLLLNFQKLEDSETFYDKHFLIYLQILISTALDPKFWDGIESDPKHHDYFLTSRKIIDDIIKRYKTKLVSKIKLSDSVMRNFEKYPNLTIIPIESDNQAQPCRACKTNPSTQSVSFGDRSYDLHSYKPVKVTSELTTSNDTKHQSLLCDSCLDMVKLYSEVHHLGWRLFNSTLEKIEQLRHRGKPVNTILDECLTDDEWINKNYAERDTLWSRIDLALKQV